MMCIKSSFSIILVSIYLLCLFLSCTSIDSEIDKGVECRLYWISDLYPRNITDTLETDFRMISLNYLIINHTVEDCFLPIRQSSLHDKIDTVYKSEIITTINKRTIDTWFSVDTRWDGILKPNDSIRANLKIPEGRLIRINVKKDIRLKKLIEILELKYSRNISDTIYSNKPIPQLRFTINDTIAIHYRDTMVHVAADSFLHQESPRDF